METLKWLEKLVVRGQPARILLSPAIASPCQATEPKFTTFQASFCSMNRVLYSDDKVAMRYQPSDHSYETSSFCAFNRWIRKGVHFFDMGALSRGEQVQCFTHKALHTAF